MSVSPIKHKYQVTIEKFADRGGVVYFSDFTYSVAFQDNNKEWLVGYGRDFDLLFYKMASSDGISWANGDAYGESYVHFEDAIAELNANVPGDRQILISPVALEAYSMFPKELGKQFAI